MRDNQSRFALTSPAKRREGDSSPKSDWWRGQTSTAADRPGVSDSVDGACPLHHARFAGEVIVGVWA